MAAPATTLPKEISKLGQEVKLFGKWDTQEWAAIISCLARIADEVDHDFFHFAVLKSKISPLLITSKFAMPFTCLTLPADMPRSNSRRHKCLSSSVWLTGKCSEYASRICLINISPSSLMMKGRNNGKKLLTVRIVAHAFEIIHLLTDQNPIQVRHSWNIMNSAYKLWFYSRFLLMPSWTLVPEKIQRVSVRKAPSVVKPSMFPLSVESTNPSPSLLSVYVSLHERDPPSHIFARVDSRFCLPQRQVDRRMLGRWAYQRSKRVF